DAARITAGGDVLISAASSLAVLSYGSTVGGGVGLSVGEAHADTVVSSAPSVAAVGAGTIITGRNVTVTADSDHVSSATAISEGGAGITGKIAETTSSLTFSTLANIGDGAQITASDAL